MPVNESAFRIRVSTSADTSELERYIAVLEKAKRVALKGGGDGKIFDDAIANTRAEIEKLKKPLDDSGKAAHEAAFGHHEMHAALHLVKMDVGEILGPIGELAHFLSNPYILAISGVSLAIKMLVERHQEWIEATKKQILASRESAEEMRQAHTEAVQAEAAATEEWARQQLHALDNVNLLTEAMQRQIAMLQQVRTDTDATRTAVEKLHEAQLRLAAAQSHIADPLMNANLTAMRNAAEDQRNAAEDQERRNEIKLKIDRATADEGEADAARSKIESFKPDRRRNQELINRATDAISDAQKRIDEQQLKEKAAEADAKLSYDRVPTADDEAAIERHRKLITSGNFALREGSDQFNVAMADFRDKQVGAYYVDKAKADAANTALESQTGAIKDQKDLIEKYKKNIKDIDKDIAAQEALVTARHQEAQQLTKDANQMQSLLDAHIAARTEAIAATRQLANVERQTALVLKQQQHTASQDELAELAGMSSLTPGQDVNRLRQVTSATNRDIRLQGGHATAEQMDRLTRAIEQLTGIFENPNATQAQQGSAGAVRGQATDVLANAALDSARRAYQSLRTAVGGGAGTAAQMQQITEQHAQIVALVAELHLTGTAMGMKLNAVAAELQQLQTSMATANNRATHL